MAVGIWEDDEFDKKKKKLDDDDDDDIVKPRHPVNDYHIHGKKMLDDDIWDKTPHVNVIDRKLSVQSLEDSKQAGGSSGVSDRRSTDVTYTREEKVTETSRSKQTGGGRQGATGSSKGSGGGGGPAEAASVSDRRLPGEGRDTVGGLSVSSLAGGSTSSRRPGEGNRGVVGGAPSNGSSAGGPGVSQRSRGGVSLQTDGGGLGEARQAGDTIRADGSSQTGSRRPANVTKKPRIENVYTMTNAPAGLNNIGRNTAYGDESLGSSAVVTATEDIYSRIPDNDVKGSSGVQDHYARIDEESGPSTSGAGKDTYGKNTCRPSKHGASSGKGNDYDMSAKGYEGIEPDGYATIKELSRK